MATTWRGFGNFASREPTRRHGSKFPLGGAVTLPDDGQARRIAGELLGQGVKAQLETMRQPLQALQDVLNNEDMHDLQ